MDVDGGLDSMADDHDDLDTSNRLDESVAISRCPTCGRVWIIPGEPADKEAPCCYCTVEELAKEFRESM